MRSRIGVPFFVFGFGLVGCGTGGGAAPDALTSTATDEPLLAASGPELSLGATGDDVRALHAYFKNYGYFPNADIQERYPAWRAVVDRLPAEDDVYDDATARAVSAFQYNAGLEESGVVDAATRQRLSEPRCGEPDNLPQLDTSDKFDVVGNSGNWGSQINLKLKLANLPPGVLSTQAAQWGAAFLAAAKVWEAPTQFTFSLVTSGTADITANFSTAFCKGGSTFVGYAMASGAGPGNCITFNTGGLPLANWSIASTTPSNSKDFQSIAAHEIGHVLGMNHSGYSTAVMYPDTPFGTQRRVLTADDTVGAYADAVFWNLIDGSDSGDTDVDIDDGARFYTTYVTALPALPGGLTVWYFTNGGSWTTLPGQGGIGASRIASNNSAPWIVQSDGDIYHYNTANSTWEQKTGCATDVGVGSDDSVWILGCASVGGNFPVFKWDPGTSKFVSDKTNQTGVRLSVGKRLDSGLIVPWVVKADGSIYARNSTGTETGSYTALPGGATDIAANAAGYTWAISNVPHAGGFTIMALDIQPGPNVGNPPPANHRTTPVWFTVQGGAINIATDSGGNPILVNNAHQLFVTK